MDFQRHDGSPAGYGFELVRGHFLGNDADAIRELSCELGDDAPPYAPHKTTLVPNGSLSPFQTLMGTAYNKLPTPSYEDFPYDWRLDIRYNGYRLLDYLRKNKPPNQRWNLTGHSQGGLVILAASKLCTRGDEFATLVHRIALVGCPIFGTMRAAGAILKGDNFGGVASNFFLNAAPTWPAISQMLPHYEAVAARPGWSGQRDELWHKFAKFAALAPHLKRARDFHTWLNAGGIASHLLGGIDLRLYFSSNHPTPFRFALDNTGAPVISDELTDGDSLVPFEQTLLALNRQGLKPYTRHFRGKTLQEHLSLFNDGRVVSVVDRFLSQT